MVLKQAIAAKAKRILHKFEAEVSTVRKGAPMCAPSAKRGGEI